MIIRKRGSNQDPEETLLMRKRFSVRSADELNRVSFMIPAAERAAMPGSIGSVLISLRPAANKNSHAKSARRTAGSHYADKDPRLGRREMYSVCAEIREQVTTILEVQTD